MKKVNLIISGGFGSRLWPLSTPGKPKQFLKVFDGKSLFQNTVERNKKLVDSVFVVTNEKHWSLAKPQLESCAVKSYDKFLEPSGRNTAPAIAIACMKLDPDDLVFVSPSDHLIEGDEYEGLVKKAFELASDDHIVTFGIPPSNPHTGYGYIQTKGEDVLAFHEKPDLEVAKKYIKEKSYYWNSGMFVFKAGIFLKELKKHSSSVYAAIFDLNFESVSVDEFNTIPSISVDYAVMEKTKRMKFIPGTFKWDDLGDFESLFSYWANNPKMAPVEFDKDENHNYSYTSLGVKFCTSMPHYFIESNGFQLVLEKGMEQQVKSLNKT